MLGALFSVTSANGDAGDEKATLAKGGFGDEKATLAKGGFGDEKATLAKGGFADEKTSLAALTPAGALARGPQAGAGSGAAAVESPSVTSEGWHSLVAANFFLPWVTGEVKLGPLSKDFELGLGTIIEQLKGLVMIHGELRNSRLGFTGDYLYANIGKGGAFSVTRPDGSSSNGDLQLRLQFIEAWPYYRFGDDTNAFDLIGGIRHYSIRVGVTFDFMDSTDFRTLSWTDPLVGVRWMGQIKPKLKATARADFAGFGAGSQFTYNLLAGVHYQLHPIAGISVQFRWLDIDYEKGALGSREFFKFDASLYGPVIAMTFVW
jgi:hypothetical protein